MITTKQLHDMKYNQSKSTGKQPQTSEDEISDIIDMGQNEFKFIIREIKQFPEPFIVLATDEQLNDLERFSCDDAEFITMSVDPTFKIGKFNVTPISFRNLTLSIDCEHVSCPVVMGPLLVHFSKTEEIYTAFFQTLLRLRPSLSLLKAYGTDGETALCNALGKVFPEATSLRCFKHVESNIKMKISELRLSKNESRFLDDIFYGESALLESENGAQFDNLFMEIEKTWAVLDVSGKFTQYIKTLVPMMKTSMIAPVRTRAGLGFPPSRYYTNDSESNNFRLKHWLGFRETSIPKFIRELASFIEAEKNDAQKAYCNLAGKYFVRMEFREQLECKEYFKLSVNQRNAFLKKVSNINMSDLLSFSKIPNGVNTALANCGIISVPFDKTGINISKFTLKNIWSAATELIQNSHKVILPAP